MKRLDNWEKANARATWDTASTTSRTPSVAGPGAPDDDNESLLMDLNDVSTLPQPTATRQPNAQRPPIGHQQNGRGGPPRRGRAQSQPPRAPAQHIAAQYDGQPQRAVANNRGRGASYVNQVNAARHAQNNGRGGHRSTPNRTPPYHPRGQHYGQSQASMGNRHRAQSTSTALREVPSPGYQQTINRDRSGTVSHSIDENAPGSMERPTSGNPNFGRRGQHNKNLGKVNAFGEWSPKKLHWPKPNGLTTTRREIDRNVKNQMKNERERFLQDPIEEDRILAYGFYIWPQEDGRVVDVLGTDLAPLCHLRMSQKVYIQCLQEDGLAEILKISSESAHSDTHIAEAIRGIRLVVADARARAILATPKYFVIPPAASAMQEFIGPKQVITETAVVDDVETTKNVMCIGTLLVGQDLPEMEQQKRSKTGASRNSDHIRDFKDRLSSSLMELAPLKTEMRMRVHFGHVVFRKFPPQYTACQQSITEFTAMLGHPNLSVEIDRMIPGIVAFKMAHKIVGLPDRFRPASGRVLSLLEVPAKHTEILFVTTRRGDEFRVEAEIDARYDEDTNWSEEFQVGSYNVFRDDRRDKRVELSTIDPERQVDYTLQVITDNMVEIPDDSRKEFEKLIEGSISKHHRVDSLTIRYPQVHPDPRYNPELQITKLVMRSVIQYALQNSGFVVELSFYRTWYGPDTKPEPQIAASISMFHPQWDWQMESMENSTAGRNWKRGLSNFFENGFDAFFNEVQEIQDLLSVTAKEAEQEAAARQADMEAQAALEVEREAAQEAAADQIAADAQIALQIVARDADADQIATDAQIALQLVAREAAEEEAARRQGD
ncbi:hypothetical protein BGZ57DRAFT_365462 [Hyaloscypha finlandica]|nr:hypothetical protein BGZ57DRAFT_365462 [Hyaloscypha finlandica]